MSGNDAIRYEPHESPPQLLSWSMGFQTCLLSVGPLAFSPLVIAEAAGMSDEYARWAVFAAMLLAGLGTALQSLQVWRVGAGYRITAGSSFAFIPLVTVALLEGGPPLVISLGLTASLVRILMALKLPWLRRIVTPAVSGVFYMLIPVTLAPVIYDMIENVPTGTSSGQALAVAAVSLVAIGAAILQPFATWRMWAVLIGAVAGCVAAALAGFLDLSGVVRADWGGVPGGWPGFGLDFGLAFWSLLPAYVVVTLSSVIGTLGQSIAIQQVSWRQQRAVDYRAVQNVLTGDGLSNLLYSLAAIMPSMTYPSSVTLTAMTGVAARRVGLCTGALFVAMAFLPKLSALIFAIPKPVVSALLLVLAAMMFAQGISLVSQAGSSQRQMFVVGVSFFLGIGFEFGMIPTGGGAWASVLGNGITVGGGAAILLTVLGDVISARRAALATLFDDSALPAVLAFADRWGASQRFSSSETGRLRLICEEALATLVERATEEGGARRLRLSVTMDEGVAVLDFVTSAQGDDNVADLLAMLDREVSANLPESQLSLRLLRGLAASVEHRQYHGVDILTVRADLRAAPK